ncbi:MAG: DUF4185 domain-containing protein [Terracidiphilus sp.]
MTIFVLLFTLLLIPEMNCGGVSSGGTTTPPPGSPHIVSIQVTQDVASYPFFGDLWANTWADDDEIYFSFGDGTGLPAAPTRDGVNPGAFVSPWAGATQSSPGCYHIPPAPAGSSDPLWGLFCGAFDCSIASACYPIAHFTDSGLVAMSGSVPNFNACPSAGCLSQVDLPGEPIPTGGWRNDDKVSSLLYVNGILYYAGHSPSVTPTQGYIATSTDKGKTWTIVPGTPWTGSSEFRVLMFINMGQSYQLNTDGYAYVMGTPLELETTYTDLQSVYLARVPVQSIASYSSYQYLTAVDGNGNPTWGAAAQSAIPLAGLTTLATGSAMYHAGTQEYLFLAGVNSPAGNLKGTLYAAPEPWGPWAAVGTIPGVNIDMLISKGAGSTSVYYTAAGGTEPYNLNIGRIDMQVAN